MEGVILLAEKEKTAYVQCFCGLWDLKERQRKLKMTLSMSQSFLSGLHHFRNNGFGFVC
jgi:hypothetical protein